MSVNFLIDNHIYFDAENEDIMIVDWKSLETELNDRNVHDFINTIKKTVVAEEKDKIENLLIKVDSLEKTNIFTVFVFTLKQALEDYKILIEVASKELLENIAIILNSTFPNHKEEKIEVFQTGSLPLTYLQSIKKKAVKKDDFSSNFIRQIDESFPIDEGKNCVNSEKKNEENYMHTDSLEVLADIGFPDSKTHQKAIFLNTLGCINLGKNLLEEALNNFDESIKLNSFLAESFSNRGLCKKFLGLFDEALLDYKKAVKLEPKLFKAHYNLGILMLSKKKYNDALLKFNEVIKLSRDWAPAYHAKSVALKKLGRLNEAKNFVLLAIKKADTTSNSVLGKSIT